MIISHAKMSLFDFRAELGNILIEFRMEEMKEEKEKAAKAAEDQVLPTEEEAPLTETKDDVAPSVSG